MVRPPPLAVRGVSPTLVATPLEDRGDPTVVLQVQSELPRGTLWQSGVSGRVVGTTGVSESAAGGHVGASGRGSASS